METRKRELISSLFWMGVGCVFCIGAWKYGIFRGKLPGAGFFPFMAGTVLIALSLSIFILSIRLRQKSSETQAGEESFFARQDSWKNILLALAALFAYFLALSHLGFLLTTILFMVFLLRVINPQSWIITLTVSILTASATYILFNLWLKVRLPAGALKI